MLALQTIVVLTLDGTAQDVGWLNSARLLPYLLLGVFVGALVGLRRRRPVLVTSDLASAVLLSLIPVAWWAGVLSLPLLMAIVACSGASGVAIVGSGGSIPLTVTLQEQFPDAEFALYGVEDPLANIHGVDESVDPTEIERIAVAEAAFLLRNAR